MRMEDMLMAATLQISDTDNAPNSHKQAMKLIDADTWMEACATEIASLVKNRVFEIVDRPACKPVIITSKCVFMKKKGVFGNIEKYKARMVARRRRGQPKRNILPNGFRSEAYPYDDGGCNSCEYAHGSD